MDKLAEQLATVTLAEEARQRARAAATNVLGPDAVAQSTVVEGLELNSYVVLGESAEV